MPFVETPVFTRAVTDLLDDEQYRSLQLSLLLRPTLGQMIRGSGGIRKLRWALAGKGKRGSIRVIYFWDGGSDTCYMLYAYSKSAQEDLTASQLRTLRKLVREEFG